MAFVFYKNVESLYDYKQYMKRYYPNIDDKTNDIIYLPSFLFMVIGKSIFSGFMMPLTLPLVYNKNNKGKDCLKFILLNTYPSFDKYTNLVVAKNKYGNFDFVKFKKVIKNLFN